jgi:preflagellin peptidase FlaK
MQFVEILYGLAFLVLAFVTTKSDIESGHILNKVLMAFCGIALALDVIYYLIFAQDLFLSAVWNTIIVATASLYLYYSHAFAGGDCKLAVVMSMLYPAEFYWVYHNSNITLIFSLCIAIFYGYAFLICSAISSIFHGRSKLTVKYIKSGLGTFFKAYIIATIYITGLNLGFLAFTKYIISVNQWIPRILCFALAWAVGRFNWLHKWPMLGAVLIIDVLGSMVMKVFPLSLNPVNYILVFVLLICQMTIRNNLYESIPVSELQPGMILSTFSSVLMQGSRVRGLPGISNEDLRNRLSVEEIDSIQRWAKSREVEQVSIVKKIPFALFITLGYVSYFILGWFS